MHTELYAVFVMIMLSTINIYSELLASFAWSRWWSFAYGSIPVILAGLGIQKKRIPSHVHSRVYRLGFAGMPFTRRHVQVLLNGLIN